MLKREELESLKEGIERGGVIDISIDDLEPLEDAAPKLALACLDALAIAVALGAWGMCEMLRDALEAAGVEVEP